MEKLVAKEETTAPEGILAQIQKPREVENRGNFAMVAAKTAVLTLAQWIPKYCPKATSASEIKASFEETDQFVKTVLISGKDKKKPFLMNGILTMEPFIVYDFQAFLERFVTEEGFAEKFGLHIVDRPNLEALVTKKK